MRALFLEPFASSSHLALFESLKSLFPDWSWELLTLPDRQWKWRNRLGAFQFSQQIDPETKYDLIICGSLLNVTELRALNSAFRKCPVIVYFHENQFAYPNRSEFTDSEKQIVFNNITSILSSDLTLFNSEFNRATFIKGAEDFLKSLPVDVDVSKTLKQIQLNSDVYHIPVIADSTPRQRRSSPPLILWNHRWEHDKNPELFFDALKLLRNENYQFKLAVIGESFAQSPAVFERARQKFSDEILHWGFVESRDEYQIILGESDIVVSTAQQEFYGISITEAVASGAVPVVPDMLVYPELYPEEFRYPCNLEGLINALKSRLNQAKSGALPERASMRKLVEDRILPDAKSAQSKRFLELAKRA